MRKAAKFFRSNEFKPHSQDADAVKALEGSGARYRLNPRGQIWHLGAGADFNDEHATLLHRFPRLISVSVGNSVLLNRQLTDFGVRQLSTLANLQALMLDSCFQVTDEVVTSICSNPRIRWLCLNCPNISDAGTGYIGGGVHLLKLGLVRSRVTGNSLHHLGRLKNLRRLILSDCEFSRHALERLKGMLPRCKVVF